MRRNGPASEQARTRRSTKGWIPWRCDSRHRGRRRPRQPGVGRHHPRVARVHRDPQRVGRRSIRTGKPGHMAAGGRSDRRTGPEPGRSPALTLEVHQIAGSHAGDPRRGPGRRRWPGRRHRAPLRPSRQAAASWPAGGRASGRGSRCSRATASTAGAAPTTGTPRSPPSPRSRRSAPPAAPTRRCIVLIEASEESRQPRPAGPRRSPRRPDRPHRASSSCLDSGCSTTTGCGSRPRCVASLGGELTVEIAHRGRALGDAGGVVPSTFRIARQLLSRIEDEATGDDPAADARTSTIPSRPARVRREATATCGDLARRPLPVRRRRRRRPPTTRRTAPVPDVATGARASSAPTASRPRTGGQRAAADHDRSSCRCGCRRRATPPPRRCRRGDAHAPTDPPYGARVTFTGRPAPSGWNAPPFAPWLVRRPRRGVDGRRSASRPAHVRRGRHDPVHGDARRALPDAQFVDHRRARPRQQRPRAQRVPPRPDGATHHQARWRCCSMPTASRAVTSRSPADARS